MANYDEVTTQPQRKNSTVATGVSDQHWLITTKSKYNSSQKNAISTSGAWVTCSLSNTHVSKNYSDQYWYEMKFHLSILHTDFIWWHMSHIFEIHVQKNYSDQRWYEIYYPLTSKHTNFIWWLVNGLKNSDCHHMNLSPSGKK